MLSQTCIDLFLVVNTKEDISKNVGNQTAAGPLDSRIILVNTMELMGTSNCLVFHILQNSMWQKKETHSGLKLILSE